MAYHIIVQYVLMQDPSVIFTALVQTNIPWYVFYVQGLLCYIYRACAKAQPPSCLHLSVLPNIRPLVLPPSGAPCFRTPLPPSNLLATVGSLASTGKYKVKGLVRNLEKAKEALVSSTGGDLEIELEQGDILDESSLVAAMKVCNGPRSRNTSERERRVETV